MKTISRANINLKVVLSLNMRPRLQTNQTAIQTINGAGHVA
jgi:hypothetical protein